MNQHVVPWKERYFEDYSAGESIEYGEYLVTEDEIIDFARRYDPQPFHVDRDAAAASIYGGIIGSGWMTASIMMRLMADHIIPRNSGMGSPGIDELRWMVPVRPGDRLRMSTTVLETRRSQSKPDRGIVRMLNEAVNQDGKTVASFRGMGLYLCRNPEQA